jgi:hypothetical protein
VGEVIKARTKYDFRRVSPRDAPPGLPLPGSPLLYLPPKTVRRTGPHPSAEGRGRCWVWLAVAKGKVVVEGRMKLTTTVDAVVVSFKLRSQPQRSCSISTPGSAIRKLKVR